ncbi:hypothetical protein BC834DRAFT_973591 [Gloeopeniophorella convolvens]|nr:hypothetical protein BC834DRAFT_973591 [Gloeopeniophorella convolvens]
MAAHPSREYTILLSHLHKPTSTLPLLTLQSLIAHFLAQTPTPTPLTATVISSPLFRPFAHAKLAALITAFRHSVHLRLKALDDEETGLFTRGVRPRMVEWVRNVVKGFKGGQGVIRFVGAGGILLGLEDLKEKLGTNPGSGGVRAKAEDELVIALAEIMEVYGAPRDSSWEKEFHPETEHGELDVLSLSMLFATQFLPHVFSERIKALPLTVLLSHLMTTIETTFASGTFLGALPSSCSTTPSGQISLKAAVGQKQPSFPYDGPGAWRQSAPLAGALSAVTKSQLFSAIPSLASMGARIFPLLTESNPREGWSTMESVISRLEKMAGSVEDDWAQSALASVDDENNIAPESRELATTIWAILKTLLFTTIMLSQSILSTVTYARPLSSTGSSLKFSLSPPLPPTHSSLALSTLRTLSRFSFVITKFGGVTSTSGAGFAELKRVFYSALDVLSADVEASAHFVKTLRTHGADAGSSAGARRADPLTRARQAFNLACVEQLVPLLSLETIEHHVFPLCLPHLDDASHRETYESAHSVVLATFAAHALAQPDSTTVAEVQGAELPRPGFVEKVVPFYARCLLENSTDGKLSTPQLRLAYGALTSSAGASAPALGQYCLSALLSTLPGLSAPEDAPRRHRLRLALVSTLPALPLVLLPDALDAVADAVRDANGEERHELVREVFREVMENVGDREKEYCMRWWEEKRELLEGSGAAAIVASGAPDKGKGKERESVARL